MVKKTPTQTGSTIKDIEQEEKENTITEIKNASFKALYVDTPLQKSNNSNLQCSDWEDITTFITESIINLEWEKFIRVEWENSNLFYVFTKDEYDPIEKFYIEKSWKKELVKSMWGLIIDYKWKKYTRIETNESWIFYIDILTHEKLYNEENKLINFLRKKRNWDFQIDTY